MNTSAQSGSSVRRMDLFATTRWTLVVSAGRKSSPQAAQALEELCRTYWYPLYAYVRHQGRSKEDAEDLVQSFFARFLAKNYLAQLASERGRFRAFLLAALKHFLANERDRARRQKRGGGATPLALDWQEADTRYRLEPVDRLSPDRIYDREWALALLDRVLGRLRAEWEAEGKTAVFAGLKEFLTAGKGAIRYAAAARRLGWEEGRARVVVHRLRRRYRQLLREEVAQTLSRPEQVEEELRALFAAFSETAAS